MSASLLQRLGLLYFLKKDFPTAVNYTRRAIRLLDEKCPPTTTKPILLSRWYYNLQIFYDSLHQKKDFIEALDSSITIAIRRQLLVRRQQGYLSVDRTLL
jgi:hypothetical protein